MAFKVTEWQYSNEEDKTQIPLEEGNTCMFIRDARLDDNGVYSLDMEDLQTGGWYTLRYYLEKKDEYGHTQLDGQAKGTLISLGNALAGVHIGIPNPCDVKGGVVGGYLTVKTSQKGNQYPAVYHFEPVDAEMAAFATIDQYYKTD